MTHSVFSPIVSRNRAISLLLAWLMISGSILFFAPEARAASRVSRGPIGVNGDSGFTALNGVTGGSGTTSDPYIISGWDIEFYPNVAQIGISNTRAFFIVRNVTAYGYGNGIILSNVTNGKIDNVDAAGGSAPGSSGAGIQVSDSNHVSITSTRVSSGAYSPNEGGGGPGIVVQSSSNILFANNNLLGSLDDDLSVSLSANVSITGNSVGGSTVGYGIDLSGSTNVTMSSNAFHDSGLLLSGDVKVAPDNSVNGKSLYFYHDCSNISLNNVPVGQVIINNCSNVQLSNISVSNTDVGIQMSGVSHVLIQNVTSTSNYIHNLEIAGSTNITIEHSDFSNVPLNSFMGPGALSAVSIYGSNNTIANGNIFEAGQQALSLTSDVNATVSGNTFAHSNGMLCLSSTTGVHIYHNNFLIDPEYTWFCLSDTQPGHVWDNGLPSGGNYWSNYTSSDPDNDSIGDTPQPVPGGVYQDRYPLMNPYPASIPLTIEFNYIPKYPTVGQLAMFTASAVGGVASYSYSWDFGDGSTGSGRTVAHVYGKSSFSMLVVLRVTDSASPQTSQSISHYLIVHGPPPALTASVTSTSQTGQSLMVQAGQWMRFDASASGGTSPYSYSWNFGDGTSSTGLEVFHTYTSPGTFTAVLTINDSGSPKQTATAQTVITVTNPPPPLTASFAYAPSSPRTGQAMTFTGTIGGGAPPYSSYWTFGDGSMAVAGSSATHTFSASGSYLVTFYASDSGSQTAYSQQTISVASSAPPPSQYTVSVVSGTDGNIYSSVSGSDGSWSGWTSLSGSTPSTPAVCRSGPNRVDLVVRGLDNGLYHKSFVNGTWASSWDTLGGLTGDQPACVVLNSQLIVIVRGLNSAIYYETENLQSNSKSGWIYLSGSSPSAPTICQSGSSSLELVVRGADNAIYRKTYSAGVWSASWDKNPTGVTIDSPACAVLGTTLYIVVRGATTELWSTTFDLSSRTWATSWTDLQGFTPSMPELASTTSMSRLDLVVRGMDNTIYHKSLANGIWSSIWDSFSGMTRYSVATTSDGTNLRIVVVAMDGSLMSNMLPLNSVSWSTWKNMNGSTNLTPSAA